MLFGILPYQTVFRYMTPSVDKVVTDLVDWQRRKDAVTKPAVVSSEVKPTTKPTAEPDSNLAASR